MWQWLRTTSSQLFFHAEDAELAEKNASFAKQKKHPRIKMPPFAILKKINCHSDESPNEVGGEEEPKRM